MSRLAFAPLALALLASATAQSRSAVTDEPGPEARIELLRGRVAYVNRSEPRALTTSGEQARVVGETHLEVPAGARARVVWPGRASMTVWGPSVLEWAEVASRSGASPGLVWRVQDLAWLDVEVRQGLNDMHLPAGWYARVGSGSFHIKQLPSGSIDLQHRAGSPLTLEWREDPSRARPPVGVFPGSSLRLEPLASAPVDESARARPWDDSEWPWREPSDAPGSRARIHSPAAGGTVAREPEFTDPSRVTYQPRSGRSATGRIPRSAESSGAYTNRYVAAQWRGVARVRLQPAGPVAVERLPGVEVRLAANGRRKVFVDASAKGPVWCFGRDTDHLLHPGSVVLFEEDGSVLTRMGVIEDFPATQGRPAFANLAP